MVLDPNNKENEKSQTDMIGAGLSIAGGVGLAIGSAMNNPGTGLAVGIALDLEIGTSLEKKKNSQKDND
ncbi:MAG: hypothetical protein GY755_03295 [Chloroflexi bacterium]|nr:hypothetical protein [Chloroflexota bacterium]